VSGSVDEEEKRRRREEEAFEEERRLREEEAWRRSLREKREKEAAEEEEREREREERRKKRREEKAKREEPLRKAKEEEKKIDGALAQEKKEVKMKTFQLVTLFALIASAMAFTPSQLSQVAKTVAPKVAGAIPVAAVVAPAFALDSIVESMPSTSTALEVQFGAYMAVALGTLLPVLFLVNLYIQTESRKAGREGGIDAE